MEKDTKKEEPKKKRTYNRKKKDIVELVDGEILEVKKEESDEITTNATFNLLEVIIIILITGVVVSIISGLIVYNNYGKLRFIEDSNNTITNDEINEFIDNYNLIINNYVDNVDKKELLDAAISGMYNHLGDEYSTYIDKDSTDSLSDQLEGQYDGIGVEIATYVSEKEGNITIVHSVFKNSPADKAGIKEGDILKSIDGIDLSEKNSSYIANYVKNGEKTEFEVVVTRDKKDITLKMKREHVIISSTETKTIDNNIGYIKLTTFSNISRDQIKEDLDKFDKKVNRLIIDLRDNTGGLLSSAGDIAELFVDKGKNLYQIQDRNDVKTEFKAQEGVYRKFDKIVVLINENSASASEILALALKESAGAKIVGVKSYGKGTVQETKILDSGAMVKYTTSYWLSPDGNSINKEGIKPDIEEKNVDKQLDAAKKAVK